MKKRSAVTAGDLVDPGKRGTIIIGSYRCGSHFVQDLCRAQCQIEGVSYKMHGELVAQDESTNHAVGNLLRDIQIDDRYHTIIINHTELKLDLMSLLPLHDWLLVRIVHPDKHRWMQSQIYVSYTTIVKDLENSDTLPVSSARYNGRPVLFVGNSEGGDYYDSTTTMYLASWHRDKGEITRPELVGRSVHEINHGGHHGTPKTAYEKYIDHFERLDGRLIFHQLCSHITNHYMSQMIEVDMELNYLELPTLATDRVPWQPNQYPDINPIMRIPGARMINLLLDAWQDVPGRFKEGL